LKLQTWFRRLGEPSETTEAYELGNYEYFEVGGPEGWSVRSKPTFVFEFANMA
jgi:CCR4-NOT transcriptional regulation complex NOT5 subunit